ncbi:hypothetical protein BKA24_000375 [Microbacterium marinum]|uniref:Uncharacterized protein n=1 Tax=Microbacterium marinum TaxID=421115 RepID=A0A7W7BN16_9MICO|nr:hypothetical protein [Microbacterium marinum]MBB4665666.1 hypothetical protein [Microbacterium marinum]
MPSEPTAALVLPSPISAGEDLDTLSAGLDRLQSDAAERPPFVRDLLGKIVPPIALLLVLIGVWQLYIVIANPRPDKAPSPTAVAGAFGEAWESGRLQEAGTTASNTSRSSAASSVAYPIACSTVTTSKRSSPIVARMSLRSPTRSLTSTSCGISANASTMSSPTTRAPC